LGRKRKARARRDASNRAERYARLGDGFAGYTGSTSPDPGATPNYASAISFVDIGPKTP